MTVATQSKEELKKIALNKVSAAMRMMFKTRQLIAEAGLKCRLAEVNDKADFMYGTADFMYRFYEQLEEMYDEYTQFLLNKTEVKQFFASQSNDPS